MSNYCNGANSLVLSYRPSQPDAFTSPSDVLDLLSNTVIQLLNAFSLLDSMCWFSHRHSHTPRTAPEKNAQWRPLPRGQHLNKMPHFFVFLYSVTLTFDLWAWNNISVILQLYQHLFSSHGIFMSLGSKSGLEVGVRLEGRGYYMPPYWRLNGKLNLNANFWTEFKVRLAQWKLLLKIDCLLVHGQVTIIFVVSVCLFVCLFVWAFQIAIN